MTYIEPQYQLPQYATSLDTPGRRLGLYIADVIVTFYVTAAHAIVEAIVAVMTGKIPPGTAVKIPKAALYVPDRYDLAEDP